MEKIGEIKARFAEVGERLKKASMRTEAESAAGLLDNHGCLCKLPEQLQDWYSK